MSPEVKANGKVIANVPDETNTYETIAGKPLYVNVDGINADAERQPVIVEGEEVGGRREIGLTLQGIGNSNDRRRGDKRSPEVEVRLSDRPIRVTYSPLRSDGYGGIWRDFRQTHKNPRWVLGHGQR